MQLLANKFAHIRGCWLIFILFQSLRREMAYSLLDMGKFKLHGTRGQYFWPIFSGGRPDRPKYKLKSHSAMWHDFIKQRVCHTVALPFTSKSSLRQNKNYENSNISPYKNIIFKKSSKRYQNPSRYYNSVTNLKFQHKPKYPLSKILIQS